MKKLSLVLAFVGLISAASFANSKHPQEAAKKPATEKAQTPKKHKAAKKDATKKEEAKPKATSAPATKGK